MRSIYYDWLKYYESGTISFLSSNLSFLSLSFLIIFVVEEDKLFFCFPKSGFTEPAMSLVCSFVFSYKLVVKYRVDESHVRFCVLCLILGGAVVYFHRGIQHLSCLTSNQ